MGLVGGKGGDSGGSGGGGGGGAFEIVANGRVTTQGVLSARGGNGQSGGAGLSGNFGSNGSAGTAGAKGGNTLVIGAGGNGGAGGTPAFNSDGHTGANGGYGLSGGGGGGGGAGGSGGSGGTGGAGGPGAAGGSGGGGSGGTVQVIGSVLTGALQTDTTGGGGSSNTGANGRTVIGSNARASFTDSENGSTPIATAGPTAFNPYVVGNFATPFIPDLVLGADVYGLLDGVLATSADFTTIFADKPTNAEAAVLRRHIGPTGYGADFGGFDALMFINLLPTSLSNPAFGDDPTGTDGTFLQPLMYGGTAVLAAGSGGGVYSTLGGYRVFETLISAGLTYVNAAIDGASISNVKLADGQAAYLVGESTPVPEPASAALVVGGLLGLAALRRKQR